MTDQKEALYRRVETAVVELGQARDIFEAGRRSQAAANDTQTTARPLPRAKVTFAVARNRYLRARATLSAVLEAVEQVGRENE